MDTMSEQLHEASLEKRLEAQKQLVARLISEGKDAIEANGKLYELSNALAEIPRELSINPPNKGALRTTSLMQYP
jgi:hypothetical protein